MLRSKILILALAATSWLSAEETLALIKPDAVSDHHIGQIIERYEACGLKVKAMKMERLSLEQAKKFYEEHKDRPFYDGLVHYMSSGDIVVLRLEGDDAVMKVRQLMGATNPQQAAPGTIRRDFGKNVQLNAVHGSDSPENAQKEIAFFFNS